MGFTVMVMGVILLAMGPIMLVEGMEMAPPALMLVGIGAFTMLFGFSMYSGTTRAMPFRVYDAGFTLTVVGLSEGVKRKEKLVTFDRLKRVEVVDNSMRGFIYHILKLCYEVPDGEAELELGSSDVDDPLAVMLSLKEAAPGRLMDSVMKYVDEGAFERISKRKPVEIASKPSGIAIGIFLGLIIFFSLQTGFMWRTELSLVGLTGMFIPLLIILVMMVPAVMMFAKRDYIGSLAPNASLEGDRLVIPAPLLIRMVSNVRRSIPLSEVNEVRVALDPYRYRPMSKWVTVRGERHSSGFELFELFEGVSGFEREGFVLRNSQAAAEPGPPIFEKSPAKGLVLSLGAIGLALLMAVLSSPFDIEMVDVDGMWYPILVSVFMAITVPILIILSVLTSRRRALAEGFLASDLGLTIPKAHEPLRWVPSSSVDSCCIEKDGLGYYILLGTPEGSIKLPLHIAKKLKKAGYTVEDSHDVLEDMDQTEEVLTQDRPDDENPMEEGRKPDERPLTDSDLDTKDDPSNGRR
jgi:hypothetical protein